MTQKRLTVVWRLAVIVVIAFAGVCHATERQADKEHDQGFLMPARPFTAILVEYNKHNAGKQRKTRLTVSSHGMRSEGLIPEVDGRELVFIQDYRASRQWLASPDRACYSELPEGKSGTPHDGESADVKNSQTGVLMLTPCSGMEGEKLSERKIRETELSVWKCTDSQGRHYIQHFSTLLGVVIRQETQEGNIGELREISLVDQSPDYFRPSSSWREVTLEEFLTGKMRLPAYEDED